MKQLAESFVYSNREPWMVGTSKWVGDMERQGRLNSKQLKDLSAELAALSKRQSDARETEVFIRMTPQEIQDFDTRKDRISAIYVVLSNHDDKR